MAGRGQRAALASDALRGTLGGGEGGRSVAHPGRDACVRAGRAAAGGSRRAPAACGACIRRAARLLRTSHNALELPDPSSHLPDPSSHLRDRTSHLRDRTSHLRDRTSHLRDRTSHLRDRSSHRALELGRWSYAASLAALPRTGVGGTAGDRAWQHGTRGRGHRGQTSPDESRHRCGTPPPRPLPPPSMHVLTTTLPLPHRCSATSPSAPSRALSRPLAPRARAGGASGPSGRSRRTIRMACGAS